MLQSPLTLVLGAGSSRDFGASDKHPFPLGDDLRDKIAGALQISIDHFGNWEKTGSREIFGAYQLISRQSGDAKLSVSNLVSAGSKVATALPGCESIDDLLERHDGNLAFECSGKLGIAKCILDAEARSPLRQNPENIRLPAIDRYSRHWLAKFLHTITKSASQHTLPEAFKNLKVINFNYDRCFEWYTHLWLRHVYGVTQSEAESILRSIEIVHPYGSLGALPSTGAEGMPFGHQAEARDLFSIWRNILTYSESSERDDRPKKIFEMTKGCKRYVFVGFAFHQQNMNLLNLRHVSGPFDVYATTVAMPAPRWDSAQQRVRACVGNPRARPNFSSSDLSAQDLVDKFGDRWTI